MQNVKEWFSEKQGFWLSLLCHLLLLLSFTVVFHPFWAEKPEPRPQMYIPSYSYQEPSAAATSLNQPVKPPVKTIKQPTSPDGLLSNPSQAQPSAAAQSESFSTPKQASKQMQGIHLLGDDKTTPKPLIKLLAKELSAHLRYPKIAVDFKIHGTVYVGFTLHPDGTLTDIKLMQRSGASVLDQAALTAVNAMSPGTAVSQFLHAQKFLVVGIIFG